MSHEITNIDKVGLRGSQAWHNLGVVIQDDLTALQAADRFGLLWPVDNRPVFYLSENGEYRLVDSHVANIRTKDADNNPIEHLLGIVGSNYQICQNRELAEFTDALSQSGNVVIESCGSIRGGERVWFLARGQSFKVGGVDEVFPYILVSNSHDGAQAIRVTPTTVRVVCSNTLHMVIPNAEHFSNRPESAAITIRHSGKIHDKLEQAKRALAYYGETLKRNVELFEALQAKKLDQEQGLELFAQSYSAFWEAATPEELTSPDDEVKRVAENRMERMRKATEAFLGRYKAESHALGLENSAWAYFNAVTGYVQHEKRSRGKDDASRVDSRRESNLFGINANRTHEVLAATLALC